MMGEHGGRKKKAKKAKTSGERDWSGCGAPSILTLAILVVVAIVFKDDFGNLLLGLLQQLTGR